MKIRVLIADDHGIVRDGLSALLRDHHGMEVLGAVSNGRDAVARALALKPDVVVMDASMPDLNGIDATRKIVAALPDTRVVALSMHDDRRFVNGMVEAGARAYLLKDCVSDELVSAIKMVHRGQLFFSHRLTTIVMAHISHGAGRKHPFDTLSERERETLQLIAEGVPTKTIAAKFKVTAKSVETYRKRIAEKLDAHSIAELTRIAVREKLVSL